MPHYVAALLLLLSGAAFAVDGRLDTDNTSDALSALPAAFSPDSGALGTNIFDPATAYRASDNAMADVEALLGAAKAEGKKALIVLGGNWCHDSVSLARHMTEPDVFPYLDATYKVGFVDVGYLDKGQDILDRWGRPALYGTPTVLVIDPVSDRLQNPYEEHIWRDSSLMKPAEVVAKLQKYDEKVTGHGEKEAAHLRAFEKRQGDRLRAAYEVIGPMLKSYKEGTLDPNFEAYWGEVRDFRYTLTRDLKRLRQEARKLGSESPLPDYPPFSWEARP